MGFASRLISWLIETFRRHSFTAGLGTAIVAVVLALATFVRGGIAAAAFGNLCIFVVLPCVSTIAYATALTEESVLTRGGRSAVLFFGLYFCLTLPAAVSYEARQVNLPALLAQVLFLFICGALIPAWFLRMIGWRLRCPKRNCTGKQSVHENPNQFRLFDLFRLITILCILLALGTATQRAYNTQLDQLLPYDRGWKVIQQAVIATLVTGSAGLVIFCVWFTNQGTSRALLLLSCFAVWLSLIALSCAAGSIFRLASRPASFLFALALWVGVLFVPMTIASHIVQWRGWRLVRKNPTGDRLVRKVTE